VSRDQRTSAGCSCRITVADMAQQLGATTDHVRDRAAHAGLVVGPDWCSRPSLAVDDASMLALSMRAAVEGARRAQEDLA
jgi:hypothetical protein